MINTILGWIKGEDFYAKPLGWNFEEGVVARNVAGRFSNRYHKHTLGGSVSQINNKNVIKIGCSKNVAQRSRQGMTWCPHMEVVATREIPMAVSNMWRVFESKVKDDLKGFRAQGGTEVFVMSNGRLRTLKNTLKTMRFSKTSS